MTVLKVKGPVGSGLLALGLPMLLATLLMAAGMLVVGASPADAATFSVNKTGDAGDRKLNDSKCDTSRNNGKQCTLRAAIEEANDTSGVDTIEFNIGSTNSVKTISPASDLPTITDTLTIDGYTQRGASPNTLEEGNVAALKVELNGSNAGADGEGLVISASDSTIKGLVINDFTDEGVLIAGFDATGNKVEGNFIGTNPTGTTSEGNVTGVFVLADSNTVGGAQPEMRNVISGNAQNGVFIFGSSSDANRVEGNFIGTTADGSGDLGNDDHGVSVFSFVDTGNAFLSNSIFSNGDLGIDLGSDGVTANDTDDPDTGANNLQNFPVIGSAIRSNTTGITTISGTLNSNPSLDFVVQCFLTDGAPASDHGEGSVLLDTIVVTTDANGDGAFFCHSSLPTLGQVPEQTVSATATNILTTG